MIAAAFVIFAAGVVFGWFAYHVYIWRWRMMYSRGQAECWRCHGSGRERSS